MGFVDTHVHFHFPDYNEDREKTIQKAREAGIETFINVGTDVPSSKASLDLASQYDFFYATAGVHPHDAKDANAQVIQELAELLKHPRMVAIGEIGLDFFRDHSPHQKQREVMIQFIELQKTVKKPFVLHCRDAYEELIQLFKTESAPPYQGIIHCFSSNAEIMKRLLDLGFYISFAGPLTYKKNDELRAACKVCPADRLLLETDAPFLPPQSKRGQRNESSYLIETAQVVAELQGVSLEELGVRTTQNARVVFEL